jgi:hypothetical protein
VQRYAPNMTRTFSIHKGDNAIYVTDNGWREREKPALPPPQYKSWTDVKEYFVKLGATEEALSACRLELEKTGDATLQIEAP